MDIDKLLQKYLDGELSAEEEREALHKFAEDPGARELLRFDNRLRSWSPRIARDEEVQVPSSFSDRVMARIEPGDASQPAEKPGFDLREWFGWLWQPRQVQVRPAGVLAALIVLLALPLLPVNYPGIPQPDQPQLTQSASVQTLKQSEDKVMLRFVFFDTGADSMAVAGDFSNWEPISMARKEVNGKTVWTGLVPLKRGEHHYMFLKNGQDWMTDPLAPIQREDGFGNKNAVIFL